MVVEVKNCNDCPFCGLGGWEGEVSVCNLDEESREIPQKGKIFGIITNKPTWCPLKTDSVTIKLK